MKYGPDVLSVFKVLILSIRPDSHFCPTFHKEKYVFLNCTMIHNRMKNQDNPMITSELKILSCCNIKNIFYQIVGSQPEEKYFAIANDALFMDNQIIWRIL